MTDDSEIGGGVMLFLGGGVLVLSLARLARCGLVLMIDD